MLSLNLRKKNGNVISTIGNGDFFCSYRVHKYLKQACGEFLCEKCSFNVDFSRLKNDSFLLVRKVNKVDNKRSRSLGFRIVSLELKLLRSSSTLHYLLFEKPIYPCSSLCASVLVCSGSVHKSLVPRFFLDVQKNACEQKSLLRLVGSVCLKELLTVFRKNLRFDRIARCGDVELNPGPTAESNVREAKPAIQTFTYNVRGLGDKKGETLNKSMS